MCVGVHVSVLRDGFDSVAHYVNREASAPFLSTSMRQEVNNETSTQRIQVAVHETLQSQHEMPAHRCLVRDILARLVAPVPLWFGLILSIQELAAQT